MARGKRDPNAAPKTPRPLKGKAVITMLKRFAGASEELLTDVKTDDLPEARKITRALADSIQAECDRRRAALESDE